MTNYVNPIDQPNPFLTTPPIVLVVRHVRVTGLGEVVVEDANTLPRFLMRVDANRVYPRQQIDAPSFRNIPQNDQKKKAF
jgi:hypothetical protein